MSDSVVNSGERPVSRSFQSPAARSAPMGAGSGWRLTALTAAMAVLASALLLAGCASPGDIRPTHVLAATTPSLAASTEAWPTAQWWTAYGDQQLDALVSQALAAQPSLQVAQLRVQQAQALVSGVDASHSVQVNGAST